MDTATLLTRIRALMTKEAQQREVALVQPTDGKPHTRLYQFNGPITAEHIEAAANLAITHLARPLADTRKYSLNCVDVDHQDDMHTMMVTVMLSNV